MAKKSNSIDIFLSAFQYIHERILVNIEIEVAVNYYIFRWNRINPCKNQRSLNCPESRTRYNNANTLLFFLKLQSHLPGNTQSFCCQRSFKIRKLSSRIFSLTVPD